jgi:hypothetical protein
MASDMAVFVTLRILYPVIMRQTKNLGPVYVVIRFKDLWARAATTCQRVILDAGNCIQNREQYGNIHKRK